MLAAEAGACVERRGGVAAEGAFWVDPIWVQACTLGLAEEAQGGAELVL